MRLTPRSAAALHLAGAVSCILLFYGIRESLRGPSRQSSHDLHCETPAAPAPVVPLTRRAGASDQYGGPARHHCSLSTLMACKGRDAPFSALAPRTDPGQSTHFPAPRTGRGAALGLRHEAPARIFTIPKPKWHSRLSIRSVEHQDQRRGFILAGPRPLHLIVGPPLRDLGSA